MAKRKIAGLLLGTAGTLAVSNAMINRRVEPLGPPLGRETGSYRWRGMDVAFTEAGDPEDPDMVLLHSIGPAATSREFRRIFDRLAEEYHLLAPDIPGFGRSDRPPISYSAAMYEAFVRDFLRELTDAPICLASGVSGAYALAASAETPIARLLLVCPSVEPPMSGHRATSLLLRSPLIGTTAFNLMTSRLALERQIEQTAVVDGDVVDPDDLRYLWQSAHQRGGQHAPASMVAGELTSSIDLADATATFDGPVTLIWGREATQPSIEAGRTLAGDASVKLVVIDRSRLMPHFEQPRAFRDVLASELPVTTSE